jgi:hypothetical protein
MAKKDGTTASRRDLLLPNCNALGKPGRAAHQARKARAAKRRKRLTRGPFGYHKQ